MPMLSDTDVRVSVRDLLTETFERVEGYYLDRGTSMFETLATVPASLASQAASPRVASLAAQVEHTAYYLEILLTHLRAGGDDPTVKADWAAAWRTTTVTEAAWAGLVAHLRARYDEAQALLADYGTWNEDTIGGWMSLAVHSAYHLGEIRQALGVIPEPAAGE
jgi:hypothetical protein